MRFSACVTLAAALLATDTLACRLPAHAKHNKPVHRPSYTRPAVSVSAAPVPSSAPAPAPAPEPSTVSEVAVPSSSAAVVATTLITLTSAPAPEPTTSYVAAPVTTPAAPVATTAAAIASSLTADQQNALDAHNAARSEVGQAALTWDEGLAADAQAWATNLVSVGSLTHAQNTGEGENLYWQSGSNTPYINAANAWIAEKSSYSGQKIGDGNFSSYGHYTQIVWSSTTKVGMAIASDGKGGVYVVARYTPAGNYIGETPY